MSFSITSIGITTDNLVNEMINNSSAVVTPTTVQAALNITSGVKQAKAVLGQTAVFSSTAIPGAAGLTQLYIPDTITPLQIPSSTPIVGCVLSNAGTTPVSAVTFGVGLTPSSIAPGISAGTLTAAQQISSVNIPPSSINAGISSFLASPNSDTSSGAVNTYVVLAATGATLTGQILVTLYVLM